MNSEQESANSDLVLSCMKTILYAFVLLFFLSFIGCKPKETTLSGQAFIVTRGGENIKLGLVEVQLIERDAVKEYIQKKQPAIDAEIASRQRDYEFARNLLIATNKVDVGDDPYLGLAVIEETNYLAILKLIKIRQDELTEEQNAGQELRRRADSSRESYESRIRMGLVTSHLQVLLDENALEQNGYRQDHIASDIRKLSERIGPIEASVVKAENQLNATPNAEIYFENISQTFFGQKTVTDADGKFSFSYPPDKKFTIFAHAERLVGDKPEKYYWLVNAPSGVEKAQLFLSNNNLVFTDPDGYFKIKPKPEFQESTPKKNE